MFSYFLRRKSVCKFVRMKVACRWHTLVLNLKYIHRLSAMWNYQLIGIRKVSRMAFAQQPKFLWQFVIIEFRVICLSVSASQLYMPTNIVTSLLLIRRHFL
jgi:hypothetical protein